MLSLRRMRGRISDVIGNNPVLYFLAGFVVVGFVFLHFWRRSPGEEKDLLVEVFGFLLDIMLFGVFLSLYDKWRERRTKIRHYHDELRDFCSWEGQEGVLRKAGIIKRLNEMRAGLPDMYSIVLSEANLSEAELMEASLDKAKLEKANLVMANLRKANLRASNLNGANLGLADLEGANLEASILEGACLEGTNLRGVSAESANLVEANLLNADLGGANLSMAHLMRANLTGADLRDANLRMAYLMGVNLRGVYLGETHLEGAHLEGANLAGAKGLTWAQLKGARLDDKTILPDYLKREEKKGQGKE